MTNRLHNWIKKDDTVPIREVIKSDIPFLSFPLLESVDFISHGFSTRLGGISEGIFSSMNLSFSRGDDDDAVMENYRRIGDAIGFKPQDVVLSHQTHTTNIRVVTENDRGKGITVDRDYDDIDGLMTDVPGLALATFFADCVPLYFVDPIHKAIALSHSGWKGTVHRMGECTIRKMTEVFGTDPADLICAIGPSICQDCYEVSEDVIEEFRKNFPESQHRDLFYKKPNDHYQLDLWKANEYILLDAGVLKENIAVTNICTCCNPDLLFSHRASKGKRGNLAAFLMIR